MKNIGPFFKTSIGLWREWIHLIRGIWKVWHLQEPIVTIFGGASVGEKNPFMNKAHELGHLLRKNNISIITGGGPGIMRAIDCGATHGVSKEQQNRVIGVSVKGIDENIKQDILCPQELIVLDSFFTRKLLMINYSKAFLVFPGGFGTLDEFFGVVTLLQMRKLSGVPVILIGTTFWAPVLAWLQETVLGIGLIKKEDLELIRVTDDLEEALAWLREHL
jgi:uncharacterized protein (TIGR00730 family)